MILRTISFGKPTYWVAGKFPCNCDQCYQRYSMVIYGYIITYSVGNILPFKHVASWCVCDLGWLKLGEAEIHSPKLESMIAASGCQEHNVKFIDPKWDDKHWWLPSVMADGWVPSLTYFLFWRRQIPDKEITLLFKRWSETTLTNLNFLKFCTIGSGFKSPPNCALLGIFDCYWIYYLIYQLHINTVWSYLRSKTNRFPQTQTNFWPRFRMKYCPIYKCVTYQQWRFSIIMLHCKRASVSETTIFYKRHIPKNRFKKKNITTKEPTQL